MKNLKRFGTFFLSLILALALAVPAFAAGTGYSDVADNAWYAGAVAYVTENGLMNGTGTAAFSPNANMELAMLVTILHRDAGTPAAEASAPDGVPAGSWYEAASAWADVTGLLWDIDTAFTGAPLAREDMVTILWRYAGSPIAESEDFADETQISAYAAQAVDWSRYTGVVSGKPGNLFDPKGSATRAELATILQNFLTMEQPAPAPNPTPDPEPSDSSRILIAYFSATNNTENIANHLNAILDAGLYEIVPETPYTSTDLNYSDSSTRATREQNDASARPAISGSVDNMADYDVIFLGYPIWWGQAPRIISTFLESYDFAGKTIVPFCTSGSSGIGSSAANLHSLASAATWMDGSRFSGSASQSAVESWVDGLGLN